MRPLFKLNRYSEGIEKGIDQIIYYSKHEFKAEDVEEELWGLFVFFYVFAGLFLLITLLLAKGLKRQTNSKRITIIILFYLYSICWGVFINHHVVCSFSNEKIY